ncbi:SIR2 family protein [Anaerocolumna sp. AGMB13020]|uniref:SIR2 family protein n=1 Tax=Anaerocolumna sp. AGMB13020 TaxID=3081750 RepID=UPI0029539079|nr:SIR2 family protein [Anaerocolumna sp. AGMB13020]WOO36073.1 SIR2 family protein [Anaerocolumna sp. AGMB13020]
MNHIEEEIIKNVSSFRQLPYLFVGTGMSMRYSNAPDWNMLLFTVWSILNTDKEEQEFKRLRQGIENEIKSKYGDINDEEKKYYINPILASVLQEKFHHSYYKDTNFPSKVFTKEEDKDILDKNFDPFKYYISKEISQLKLDKTKPDFPEIRDLMRYQNKIAGIITTNYDSILEDLFSDFSVMIGQDNMLLANSFNIFEIFKIHGCATSPNSLIITNEDYLRFRSKLKYLSAKLLTIFVEHPIIFIGYGMGDINVRSLFKEIAECLSNEQINKIKSNFIFLTPAFGSEEKSTIREIVFGKSTIAMKEFILNDYSIFYKALSNIQSSLPIKLARKLQDMVCNYVYSATATNNILFGTINSPDLDDSKAAIYFGELDTVRQIGFSHYTIDDILEDVLLDNKSYLVNEQLITKTFKNIRSSAGTTLLPIYKYIKALNYNINNIPDTYNIIKSYNDVMPTSSERRSMDKSLQFNKIADIENKFPNHIPKQVCYIKKFASYISVTELEDYLKKHYRTPEYIKYLSTFKRLIALYDFKKYK